MVLLFGSYLLGRNATNYPEQPAFADTAVVVDGVDDAPRITAPAASTENVASASAQQSTSSSSAAFWARDLIQTQAQAQAALFSYLAIDDTTDMCNESGSYACEQIQLSTWNELKELNRPAVLGLIGADKKLAFTTLIGLDEMHAQVLIGNQVRVVDWQTLAPLWNGMVFYLWSRPPGFVRPLAPGDRGPAVVWLAQQFAILDQQPSPLTHDSYSPAMKKRVEIFQTQQNLRADGIAGAQTLRKLNEVLGLDQTLDEVAAEIADAPVGAE
jgi:general secretion pathway protein A